jgi:RHS repeat-associated protein
MGWPAIRNYEHIANVVGSLDGAGGDCSEWGPKGSSTKVIYQQQVDNLGLVYDMGLVCVTPGPAEKCSNGKDDNGDGYVDCQDPTCAGTPDCQPDSCIGCCGSGGSSGGTKPPNSAEMSYLNSGSTCQCSKDRQPCEPTSGEPVEVNTGRQTDAREDLTIPGRVPVTIAPFYRSTSDYLSVHGYGYSSLLTSRLIHWSDSTWTLRDERGDREDFDVNGNNLTHRIAIANLTLIADSVYWEPQVGEVYAFTRKEGVLGTFRDRRGGGILFSYADSAGAPYRLPIKGVSYTAWPPKTRGVIGMDYRVTQLTSLDNPAQTIALNYDTTGLLVAAQDFSGRQVQYTYDLKGNQNSVTFPDGTLRRFLYQDTTNFHRLTAFDAKPIGPSLATNMSILTQNLFDGKNRVDSQTYQGATYGFDHASWHDSTFHTLVGVTLPNAAMRVNQYYRSTTVNQSVPDGHGGSTLRSVTYNDLVQNEAQQDTGSGNLLEPLHWLSRTLQEKEGIGPDTLITTLKYDQYNNVIEQDQPDGTVVTFQRDVLSRVILQTEAPPSGRGVPRYIRYTYDGNSDRVLHQVNGTALDSTVKDQTYDANGNTLTQSVWRDPALKTTTTWTYDAEGRQVTQTDPFGKLTKYVYLATTSMQPDSTQFPDTTGEHYTRDGFGRITQTRNQLGQYSWTKYDVLGRDTVTCGYDSLCTRKVYSGPNLVEMDEGLKATPTGYAAGLRVSKYDVDGYGRRVHEWLQSGSRLVLKHKYLLDALGNELETWDNPDSTNTDTTKWRLVERKQYDGRSHLLQLRQFPSGAGFDSLLTTYLLDANGNDSQIVDPRGALDRRAVDPWNNIVRDTDGLGRISKKSFDHRNLIVADTDALGHLTSHSFDALGNEVVRIGWHADTTLWLYDRGRLVKQRTPEDRWTTYQYDSRGRLLRQTQKVGDTALAPDSNDVFTDYVYDKLGRRVKESLRLIAQHRTGYDAGGRVLVDTNALGYVTSYAYDALGRQVRQILPSADTVYTTYDPQGRAYVRRIGTDTLSVTRYDDADRPLLERTPGQGAVSHVYDKTDYVTKSTDSVGIVTTSTQDRMGRDSLVSVAGKTARKTVRDAVGRVIQQWDERGYKVSLGYDALDRLTSLTDNESNTTTFNYVDSAGGWRRTTIYPGSKTENHLYDREGRLRRFVDGRGYQTVYRYDSLSRLVGVDCLTSTGATATTSLTLHYDRLGNLASAFQGTTSIDSSVYDNLGEVTSGRQTVAGTVYTLGYAYDLVHRSRTLTLPDGSTTKQKWTPRGLLDSLWSGSKVLLRHGYKFGLETLRTYSNGIAAAETYDADGRVSGLVYTLTGKTLPNLGYTYDASGNRNLIRRNHYTTTSEAASYTPDNQLSTWGKGTASTSGTITSPTSSQSWTLDSRGNWSSWTQNGTAQARTHDGANELTAMGTTNLTWDAAGDLTSDGTLTYVWGPRGTLDTVKQGSTVKGFYGYDALGRRALKTVGALKTISIYDGWQCVYQKVTGSGTDTTKAFTFGNYVDEPVTMIRKWGSSTDTAWYLQGGNYNVEALTDRTGSVIERYEYTPYGKPTVYTGAGTDGKWFTSDDVSSTVSAKGNNVLFQGRELDAESNLMFYRTRYYQPTLGRFVSRDPIRYQAQDENFYRFESGNPIQFVDPIGLTTSTHSTTLNGDFSNLRGPYDGYFGVTKALATPTFMSPSEIRSSTSEEDDCNCTSKKKYTVCANGVGYYSVVVKVDIWLSSWIPPKSASPAQRSEWNRARAATAIHEQGHADIYNAAAGHHEIPISGACGSACTERAARSAMIKSVGSALQKDFDSMWSDANQKSDQYDADTNHGATQGATLNQGVQ